MIVVKKSSEIDESGYIDGDHAYFVFCVQDVTVGEYKGHYFYVFNDHEVCLPYPFFVSLFNIVDPQIPEDWIKTTTLTGTTYSFPEWANDPKFYNYLIEDEWQPEKTKWAVNIVRKKYDEYLEAFARKKFGSVEAFKKRLLDRDYYAALELAKTRGYEKPDRDKLAQSLPLAPLNLDEIYGLQA